MGYSILLRGVNQHIDDVNIVMSRPYFQKMILLFAVTPQAIQILYIGLFYWITKQWLQRKTSYDVKLNIGQKCSDFGKWLWERSKLENFPLPKQPQIWCNFSM